MAETAQQRLTMLWGLLALLLLAVIAAWQASTFDLLLLLLACCVSMKLSDMTGKCVFACAGLVLCLLALVAVAESALQYFFARPLELKYDLFLLPALWDLLEDSGGTAVAISGVLVLALLLVGLTWIFAAVLRRSVQALPQTLAVPVVAAVVVINMLFVPVSSTTLDTASGVRDAYRVSRGEDDFELALAQARQELIALPSDLALLKGQDFLFFFVESYGRLLWDDEALRGDFQQDLAAMERAFIDAGYLVSSRFLRSTSFGGSSWLPHMSVMSGVECRNQVHWERLLASQVRPLPDYFRARGYETVSVMPAMNITSWPEGEYFGFTRNIWAQELAYKGPRYTWSPMPDQYVLLRLQELVFEQSDAPIFAEVSMTSSHHPFTQLPVFHEGAWNHQALAETLAQRKPKRGKIVLQGMTPEQYAKAVNYSLASVAQFLARHYRRDGTILVLGDHQAIKTVHRVDPRTLAHFRDVPLHILTRDPEVHRRLLEQGFAPGINPDEVAVSMPMENLKSFFLHLLHQPPGADS